MSASSAGEPRPATAGQMQELTKSECFELLARNNLGRLAIVDDGWPVVFPVNYVLDRYTVVFRTEEGTKLYAASHGDRACFEVDSTEPATRTVWSVLVRGEVTEVTDRAELARLFLIDGMARPLPLNQAIRAEAADPRITVELNRFNLELNSSPALLAGRPFAALGGELNSLLARVAGAARVHGGRIALIGVLPTLARAHLDADAMTDAARYRALSHGLRRLRHGPIQIRIAGEEPLELTSEHISLEGANTSFQVHLRVAPRDFTRVYNAV